MNTKDTKDTRTANARIRWRVASVAICLVFTCVAPQSEQTPQRIISLVPALTQMLFAIGAGSRVAAVSSFDTEPPAVESLPRVGALLDPDVERILSLKPDLVALYGSQEDLRAQLSRAGVPYFEYRHAGLPGVMTTIRELGTRTGHEKEATALADDIERRLAVVKARAAGQPRLRTLLVFGREPESLRNIYASGKRGFLNDLLEIAGGTNVFSDIDAESVQPSTEQLLARAPDVIIEIHAVGLSAAGASVDMTSWNTLASVPAVKQRRVFILAGSHFVVPGPRVAEIAEQIARVLHPKQF